MTDFPGFGAADFDAFAESKWSSHAFNRERLEVKLKLSSLGKKVMTAQKELLDGQEMGLSEERPSIFNQHQVRDLMLFYIRDTAAKRELDGILDRTKSIAYNVLDPATHHRHLALGLRVHQGGVDVGLWLHRDAWVDWKNLVKRCVEHYEMEKLKEILSSLPPWICHQTGECLSQDAQAARMVAPEALLQGFEQAQPWTILGLAIDRQDSLLGGDGILHRAMEVFSLLQPLHHLIAWRRDNDFHALKEVLKERKQKAERQYSEIKKGDEVRVNQGLAAGRIGIVESVEHKGVVKLRFGPMVLSVKVEDLAKP